MALLQRAFVWYAKCLEHHPLITKGVTSGFITGAGDFSCQTLTYHYGRSTKSVVHSQTKGQVQDLKSIRTKEPTFLQSIDWIRTSRFVFLGTVLVAPVLHQWYIWLSKTFPGSSVAATAKRTLLDQTICAPLFLPTFITSLHLLEGKSFTQQIVPTLQQEYVELLVANWSLWVPAQLINFRFIPAHFQVLFSNLTALFWNCYISYKACGSAPPSSQIRSVMQQKNSK